MHSVNFCSVAGLIAEVFLILLFVHILTRYIWFNVAENKVEWPLGTSVIDSWHAHSVRVYITTYM